MTVASEELIHEMATVAAGEYPVEAIVLFGSHAVDTAGPDSDVDLMVIVETPPGEGFDRRVIMSRIWRALARFPVPKDILVYSRDEVERWRSSRNHVIARALEEGRVIYGSL